MKTILTACILVLGLFSQICKAQWIELNTGMENPPQFNDVYAITPDIVVVVGANGTILKTTDGGETWQQKTSGTTLNLDKIQFPTPDIGYITGSGGKLLKTTDAGETWTTIDLGETVILNSLSCINEDLIFLATVFPGFNYRLLKTEDGGETWEDLYELPSYGEILFVNNDIGFMFNTFDFSLLRTEDGGETWEGTNGISPADFIDENIGFCYQGGLLKTTDSGNNFDYVGVGSWFELQDIYAIDENNIWGILHGVLDGDPSTRGITKITSSDSETYTEFIVWENNPEIEMLSIHFADETTGYIAGLKNGKGAIWKNGTGINTMSTNEQVSKNEIKFYPNPVSDELNIILENSTKAYITLTDITGKQVYSQSFHDNQVKINTSEFTKGIYILSVKIEDQSFVKKIIIN